MLGAILELIPHLLTDIRVQPVFVSSLFANRYPFTWFYTLAEILFLQQSSSFLSFSLFPNPEILRGALRPCYCQLCRSALALFLALWKSYRPNLFLTMSPSLLKRATTIPAPLIVDPSQSFEGADGAWSTFTIAIVSDSRHQSLMTFPKIPS